MKKFIVIAAALLISAASFAQETNRDANGNLQFGGYETNKFWDNWFIQIGGGVNVALDNMSDIFKKDGLKKDFGGLAIDVEAGKWIDPCFGFRFGWKGISTGNFNKPVNGFTVGADNKFHYVHGDFMVNVSNLFAGYKELRAVNIVPYLTAGGVWGQGRAIAAGLGIMFPIRLGNVVNLVPDFQFLCLNQNAFGGDGIVSNASATLGLQFNLGRNNWTRVSTTAAAAAAALAASEAAANALKAKNDKLAAEAAAANAAKDALAKENANLKNALAEAEANAKKGVDLSENPIYAYFELGKTTLSAKELAHLEYQVKTALAQNKDQKLTITGTADGKVGSKYINNKLSKKRGEYLYKLLTEKYGLCADNFVVKNEIRNTNNALDRAAVISK